jgi:hypothetical protein
LWREQSNISEPEFGKADKKIVEIICSMHDFNDLPDVIRPRLERGTDCLEGSCSIQLSYRTIA